jgi:hypothetical protein
MRNTAKLLSFFLILLSSGFLQEVNRETQSNPGDSVLTISAEFLEHTALRLITKDSAMYLIIEESLKINLGLSTQEESELRLRNFHIDIQGTERDLLYLAHVDRSRVMYSIITIFFGLFFGSFTYLILNIISLLVLSHLILRALPSKSYLSTFTKILLIFSSIPIYTFTAMPELMLYTLMTYFFLLSEGKIEPKVPSRYRGISVTLLLIVILLTKPAFVVIAPYLLYKSLVGPNHRKLNLIHFVISTCFALHWWLNKMTNVTPLELYTSKSPLSTVLTGVKISSDLESPAVMQATINAPLALFNEAAYSFSVMNFAPILLILLAVVTNIAYQRIRTLVPLLLIGLGCLLTQGFSGGISANWRFLNIAVLFAATVTNNPINRQQLIHNRRSDRS